MEQHIIPTQKKGFSKLEKILVALLLASICYIIVIGDFVSFEFNKQNKTVTISLFKSDIGSKYDNNLLKD